MSEEDLSEDEMRRIEMYVAGSTAQQARRLIAEVRRHRAALAAERVRSVVRWTIADEVGGSIGEYGTARIDRESVERIATRAAEQLAPLTRERALELVLAAIEEYARYAEGAPLGGHGDVAHDVARRTAERLVGE